MRQPLAVAPHREGSRMLRLVEVHTGYLRLKSRDASRLPGTKHFSKQLGALDERPAAQRLDVNLPHHELRSTDPACASQNQAIS